MLQKETDCLFIGHTGRNISQFKEKLDQVIPDKQIKIENTFNLAIGYLGSYLAERGLTFDYVTSFYDDVIELEEKLAKNVKVVSVTTTFCQNIRQIREVVRYIRNRSPFVPIVIGGAYIASQLKGNTQEEIDKIIGYIGADFYINSFYGEDALYQIIRAVKEERAVDHIQNIIYKSSNGYIITPQYQEDGNPENKTINWELFRDRIGTQVPIRTSVSCPFSCSYCTFPKYAGKYQNISVEAIEKQLIELSKIEQVKSINFIDDTFNVPQERMKSILRMMKKHQFKFSWHAYFRCQFVDQEMIDLMKETNCEGLYLGLESGNQKVLDRMNKKAKVEDYIRGHNLLRKNNILTIGLFIVGFSGETKETCMDTLKFIQRIQPTFYYINPWYLERNSSIWNEREKYQITGEGNHWRHESMDDKTAVAIIQEMDEQLKDYSIKLHIHSNYLFQLLNQGISVDDIKKLFCLDINN